MDSKRINPFPRLNRVSLINIIMKLFYVYAFILVVLFSCKKVDHKNEILKTLKACTEEYKLRHDLCQISFNAVTEFKWDKMYCFTEYVTQAQIRMAVGTDTYDGGDVNDQGYRLVFLKDDKFVEYIEFLGQEEHISIYQLKNKRYFTPEDAIFFIKEFDELGRVYLLFPVSEMDSLDIVNQKKRK